MGPLPGAIPADRSTTLTKFHDFVLAGYLPERKELRVGAQMDCCTYLGVAMSTARQVK